MIPFNQQAVGFRVSRASGIDPVGKITQNGTILRSLVAGPSVFTVSDAGVGSSSLGGLSPQGFAAFPQAVTPPGSPCARPLTNREQALGGAPNPPVVACRDPTGQ